MPPSLVFGPTPLEAPSVMACPHSSHLVHRLRKNLEVPHGHSHSTLTPLDSGCNSRHSLYSSALHIHHHRIILVCFWCRCGRQRYSLDTSCPSSWCRSTPHSRWGWNSSSHSGTSGDGASHWGSTYQSPSRCSTTTTSTKRKFTLIGEFNT